MGIGFKELLIILVIAMLMFGTKKIRSIGGDVGGWIRDFKKALKDGEQDAQQEALADKPAQQAAPQQAAAPQVATTHVVEAEQAPNPEKKTV